MSARTMFHLRGCFSIVMLIACCSGCPPTATADDQQQINRTFRADVVALEQPWMWNRMGAAQPQGMMYALQRDVVSLDTPQDEYGSDQVGPDQELKPGHVRLRSDKRPRPIVLRMNVGDCMEVHFTNLLSPMAETVIAPIQTMTRDVGFHPAGLNLVDSINADGSWVGANPGPTGSMARPGETKVLKFYASAEGEFMIHSHFDHSNGQLDNGLFGMVTVQPEGAEWYRSQVTEQDLKLATFPDDPEYLAKQFMTLEPDLDDELQQRTDPKTGGKLWTLTTINPDRQTVKQATILKIDGHLTTLGLHPLVDYHAVFPAGHRHAGFPVLNMLMKHPGAQGADALELVHNDLTAIITGPDAGSFPPTNTSASFRENSVYPNRRSPYREFVIHYHNFFGVQAFEQFGDPALAGSYAAGGDAFAINYGCAGIGAEILANRIGVGPMGNKDAVDLKFEEFFLSSWAVGDPAMVVDVPANAPNQTINSPADGQQIVKENLTLDGPQFKPLDRKHKATKVFYPDDPSNVYHSYMRDRVKFRITNTGSGIVHVHHLHAHQWLRTPNSDNSAYLDSQMINAGATFTLEIAHNGSGNRNLTVGDSIFHCHLYPHFAAGMWGMWRVHDVFEQGTQLNANGIPVEGARALPDGEIEAGVPIPAIVPLPTLAMAPLPGKVRLIDGGRRAEALKTPDDDGRMVYRNPGYPFFIPGVAGHRPPHPPMDFAWEEISPGQPKLYKDGPRQGKKVLLDGGLPRHLVLDGKIVKELHTRWDFTKDFVRYDSEDKTNPNRKLIDGGLVAFELPEDGTAIEKVAMQTHATRTHASYLPNGDPGNFTLNGLPPVPGAPYAAPSVDENGNSNVNTRRYKAAVIQMDVVFNKSGWHYPQQRFITLWNDVKPTVGGERPPQPFFFRANSDETIEFWHTNLVPAYFELDDFQVRTPTDVIGQHIHLVKFDVTSSDGAANGFNYEDGTFSPDEVRERIDAMNAVGGLYTFDWETQFRSDEQMKLAARPYDKELFGTPPPYQNWNGAQTTIQRFDTDPVFDNAGRDRTLRTVFTHDHFSPSTHQQVGLYAGMLIEPTGSKWYDPITGEQMYDVRKRADGGPTSWQANIETADKSDSYREFAFQLQDFGLTYNSESRSKMGEVSGFLCNLDDSLSRDLDNKNVTLELRAAIARYGVTLSADAGVKVLQEGLEWEVGEVDSKYPKTAEVFKIRRQVIVTAGLENAESLAQGIIPGPVRDAFQEKGIVLSVTATVHESDDGPKWIIEQNGDGYAVYVEGEPKRLAIYRLMMTASVHFAAWADPLHTVNPPADPNNVVNGGPSPTLVSSFPDGGHWNVSYRSESIPLRISSNPRHDAALNPQQRAEAVDLASAFRSIKRLDENLNRQPEPGSPINPEDPDGFKFPPYLTPVGETGAQPYDPYTPLLRAYENDRIQIRTLVGAHEQAHSFTVHGVKWFFEPSFKNSGYRNVQGMSLSEHYEMLFRLPPARSTPKRPFADYLYESSAGTPGLVSGSWGLMRAYDGSHGLLKDLKPLPNNPDGKTPGGLQITCPPDANVRRFHLVAITAEQALPKSSLIYNSRGQVLSDEPKQFNIDGQNVPAGTPDLLQNPYAVIYVHAEDLDRNNKLLENVPIEPVILRACAGDWIEVTLENRCDPKAKAFQYAGTAQNPFGIIPLFKVPVDSSAAFNEGTIPPDVREAFAANEVPLVPQATVDPVSPGVWTISNPGSDVTFGMQVHGTGVFVYPSMPLPVSATVGLNAQLVAYDITQGDGANVGFNPIQTVEPGTKKTMCWYAGKLEVEMEPASNGISKPVMKATPIEFGAINLTPADGLMQHTMGLVGALIVEPTGSTWKVDSNTRAAANIFAGDGKDRKFLFREGVIVIQDDITMFSGKTPDGQPEQYLTSDGFAGTFHTVGGVNYRSDPFNYRYPVRMLKLRTQVGADWVSELNAGRLPAELRTKLAGAGMGLDGGTQVSTTQAGKAWEMSDTNSVTAINWPLSVVLRDDELQVFLNLVTYDDSNNRQDVPFDVLINRVETTDVHANSRVGGDPQTPVFPVEAGKPLRLRWLYPGGDGEEGQVIAMHGHNWQEEPYVKQSTKIGNNKLSQVLGTQRFMPYEPINMVLPSAGGPFGVKGDYLYHVLYNTRTGQWGILRVLEAGKDGVTIDAVRVEKNATVKVRGHNTVQPGTGEFAESVTLQLEAANGTLTEIAATVVESGTGRWQFSVEAELLSGGSGIRVVSQHGGSAPDSGQPPYIVPVPDSRSSDTPSTSISAPDDRDSSAAVETQP